jgi:hypothetical protein
VRDNLNDVLRRAVEGRAIGVLAREGRLQEVGAFLGGLEVAAEDAILTEKGRVGVGKIRAVRHIGVEGEADREKEKEKRRRRMEGGRAS